MPVGETDTVVQQPTTADRIADAVRRAAHLSHQARLVTSVAKEASEEGVHAAKRLIRRVRRTAENLEDVKDYASYQMKRQPFKAVGIAAGAGLVLGVAVGWAAGRLAQRHT